MQQPFAKEEYRTTFVIHSSQAARESSHGALGLAIAREVAFVILRPLHLPGIWPSYGEHGSKLAIGTVERVRVGEERLCHRRVQTGNIGTTENANRRELVLKQKVEHFIR